MRSILLITLLALLSVQAFSQNKLTFGLSTGAQLSFLDRVVQVSSSITEERKMGTNYLFGPQIEYELANHLFFRSGLNYEHSTHRKNLVGLLLGPGEGGVGPGKSNIKSKYVVSYLGLPLDIGYKLATKNENLRIVFGGGGLFNIGVSAKVKTRLVYQETGEVSVSTKSKVSPAKRTKISGLVFTGVDMDLGDKLALGIEPHLRLSPYDFDYYLNESDNKMLAEVGLMLRLRLK